MNVKLFLRTCDGCGSKIKDGEIYVHFDAHRQGEGRKVLTVDDTGPSEMIQGDVCAKCLPSLLNLSEGFAAVRADDGRMSALRKLLAGQ